jgi:hypothetical protein
LRPYAKVICAVVLFLAAAFVFLVPVRRVELRDRGGITVLSFPLYLGESFSTEYIHSVQLCPVVDEYYAVGNALWLWEERTQSTNAGLPTEAPRLGKFVYDPPWYRYLGGRRFFKTIRLRVGDAQTGRNVLALPTRRRVELFERFTGALLTLQLR